MDYFEVTKATLNILGFLGIFALFIGSCWSILWTFYLSKFKLVQELLGHNERSSSVEELKAARAMQTRRIHKD